MRVLINGLNYAPDLIGVSKYTTEMAEWLASDGHDVRIVTGPPYYPDWRIQSPYSGLTYKSERINDVGVIRCPLYVPNHPGGMRRVLHLSSFALTGLPVVLAQALSFRPHVVMGIAPTILSAPTTLLAARLCRAKAWLHVQDFELEAAYSLGILKGGPLQRGARAIEGALLRAFDRISTISQPMIDLLRRKGCRPDQVCHFRNWADAERVVPQSGRNYYRELLGLNEEDILVVYSGTMSRKQGLEIVVDAARELSDVKHIHFLLCGEGPAKARLMARWRCRGNVTFLPIQPAEKLSELLSAADIHVLPQLACAADLVLPSKLSGMLASGRPIIATAKTGTALADEVEHSGLVTPPEDVGALIDAIQTLAKDSDLRGRLGEAGRSHVLRNWNKTEILRSFEEDLMALVGEESRKPVQGPSALQLDAAE